MDSFNIALVQMSVGERKQENLDRASQLLAAAAESGAQLAVLPEMFICPYDTSRFAEYAEPQDGDSVSRLAEIAARLGIVLVAGSIPEVDKQGKLYNTSYSFGPDGELLGKHRKIHLFDIDIEGGIKFKESDSLSPGDKATIIDTPWGKVGIAICFDIRFAELFRYMALQGAHTVIVPGAFNMTTGPAHWELSFRMRAVDNQIYTAGCAPARDKGAGYISWGHSLVSDPWGRVTGSLNEEEGILIQQIDPSYAKSIRGQLPILSGYRAGGYSLS